MVRLQMCWETEMMASAGRLDVGCEKNRVQGDIKVSGLSDHKGRIDAPWGGAKSRAAGLGWEGSRSLGWACV